MRFLFFALLLGSISLAPLSAPAFGQAPAVPNSDFESDAVGAAPKSWFIPKPCIEGGYELHVTDASAVGGKHSAELRSVREEVTAFGNCMQSLDAKPFHGKRIRFSAAVRCEPGDSAGRACLWFRVDRAKEQMGFFDNMGDRPIIESDWKRYEIVGDVAEDAEKIVFGMMLLGRGTAMFDDVRLETTAGDVPTTGSARLEGKPGLEVAAYAAKGLVLRDAGTATARFPLPLAYRDQTPLTFRLQIEPSDLDVHANLLSGPGPNHVLELELRNVKEGMDLTLRYESVVLVGPSSFEAVPASASFPTEWPEEARPWMAATWCCDAADERIKKIGTEIRAAKGDVKAVIDAVLVRSQQIFGDAAGRVQTLTAVEALDKHGSCTSCANLVAALMRAAGVPARVVAGYPLWSGPLQTHYIVEGFLPGYGWYPVESTMGRSPWPNCQQIQVSIVPIEHEAEALAGRRACAAGAVPFMTLTEYAEDSPIAFDGTIKPHCDHEGRQLSLLELKPAEWRATQDWGRARWDKWLASKPEIRAGKLEFGPSSDALAAKTVAELLSALP